MTTQHTPAPWEIKDPNLGIKVIVAKDRNDCFNQVICRVGELSQQANARLIAAAPELLEALKAMVDAYRHHDGLGADLEFEPWTKAALDAIFKATGEHHE